MLTSAFRLPCRIGLSCLVVATLASCSEEEPFRKETVAVTGQVLVDGQPPASPVQIQCHSLQGLDSEHPTFSQTVTGENGSFAISTYESGDGVPPGEYVLTFAWQEFNVISMSYGGPDKFGNQYSDSKTSEFKLSVASGSEPIDMGQIQLSTKESPSP
jgi:hypothetical protein